MSKHVVLDCGDKFGLERHIDWGDSLKIGIAPIILEDGDFVLIRLA